MLQRVKWQKRREPRELLVSSYNIAYRYSALQVPVALREEKPSRQLVVVVCLYVGAQVGRDLKVNLAVEANKL